MTIDSKENPDTSEALSDEQLQEMVAAADTGARIPHGIQGKILLGTALVWSLFQLWIASPLPFMDWPVIGLSLIHI